MGLSAHRVKLSARFAIEGIFGGRGMACIKLRNPFLLQSRYGDKALVITIVRLRFMYTALHIAVKG